MILYFANRTMDILGRATTHLKNGFVITDDKTTEEVETGIATFEGYIGFKKSNRKRCEGMTATGNYILCKDGEENKFYTIIDREIDSKKQEIYVYAEDAGLDLLNEIAGEFEATEAHTAEWYINKWIIDSGFEIGINEIPESSTRKLKWESESTVTERLASIATQFGGYEISYSFDIKGMAITNKYVNIYAERGKNTEETLRLNKDVDRIIIKETVANLATALRCTGGTPENSDTPITLKGYTYDDGDFYVGADGVLRSRTAVEKWSRYVWNKEPNKLDGYSGHIIRTYSYDTTSQATLCAHAITELKKICDTEINYEIDITKLPDNVKIGDRVNIVDKSGELYLSSRILKLETSVTNKTQTATIGEHLIKEGGISQTVQELAEKFAITAKETAAAKQAAAKAQKEAEEAVTAVENLEKTVGGFESSIADAAAAAAQAKQAAANAESKVTEAVEKANTAQTNANQAITAAGNAQTTATNAATTAAAAKLDAEQAKADISALDKDLTTLSNTMTADYARKTDLTETQASLQTQITQNAAGISSNASAITRIDETANDAASQAAAAQKAADDAQALANTAKQNAAAAQSDLNAAEAELATAKANLAAVTGRVDTTEADIAAAEQAVAAAQAKADTAKTAADNAQKAANAAQSAADRAQADVNSLKTRVTTAETNISQNAEQIALRATKTEVTQTLGGYYTKTQTDAAITTKANEITSSVSATYTKKTDFDNLQIGGRNLLKNTNVEYTRTNAAATTTQYNVHFVDGYDLQQLIGKTVVFSFFQHTPGARDTSLSTNTGMQTRFGMHGNIKWKDSTGAKATTTTYPFTTYLSTANDNKRVAEVMTVTPPTGYDTIESFTFAIQIYAKPASSNAETWKMGYPKLEIGTKATDWTPAPEDMATEADLTAAETRITQTENSITSQASSISNHETRISTVEQTADGLTISLQTTNSNVTTAQNTANNAATAASNAQTAVNNLQIGGRNILLNSKGNKTTNWIYAGTIETDSEKGSCVTKSRSTTSEDFLSPPRTAKIEPNTQYTFSCDLWVDDYVTSVDMFWLADTEANKKTGTGFVNATQFVTGLKPTVNKWQRVTKTFTTKSNDYTGFIRIDNNGTKTAGTAATMKVANLKLEKGNRATDWTPAPEDVDGDISAVQTTANAANNTATTAQTAADSAAATAAAAQNTANTAKTTADAAKKQLYHSASGTNGTKGYVAFAQMKVTGTYANRPILFTVVNRGGQSSNVSFRLGNAGDTDPALATIERDGGISIWAYKVSASTWYLIGLKSEAYDTLYVTDFANTNSGITVSWVNVHYNEGALPTSNITAATLLAGKVTKATIDNAAKTATNFLSYDSTNGLLIGNKSSGAWSGNRAQILPDAFNILDSNGVTLASYQANKIQLGANSTASIIELCGGAGTLEYNPESTDGIYDSTINALTLRSENVALSGKNSITLVASKTDAHTSHISIGGQGLNFYYSRYNSTSGELNHSEARMTESEIYGLADNVQFVSRYGMTLDDVSGSITTVARLHADGGIRLANGGQIVGGTSSGTDITMLQMNANNYTMLGYGGYSNNIGATYVDGNNVYIRTKNRIYLSGGSIVLDNNKVLGAYNSSGALWTLFYLNSSNSLSIGAGLYSNTTGATNVYGGTAVQLATPADGVTLETSSNASYSAFFRPNSSGKVTLGLAANKWYAVYAANGTIQTSDRREKENIMPIGIEQIIFTDEGSKLVDLHSELFDRLQPVQYNFIDGNGKICYGLIAQDVIDSMREIGINENELDLIHHDFWTDNETGEEKDTYGLGYTNLLALLIHEVQKLKAEVKILKTAQRSN